jgi:signal transduction histidine kinase
MRDGTFCAAEGTVSANLLQIRRPWTRAPSRARLIQLSFVILAALIASYATVLSDATHVWQTATICWALTLLVMGLTARIASIVERCEREANQNGGDPVSQPVTQPRAALLRAARGAQERLAHLEQVIVRQHRFVSDAAHELRTPLTAQCVVGESVLARQAVTSAELRTRSSACWKNPST